MNILYVLTDVLPHHGQAFLEEAKEDFLALQEKERLTCLRFQKRRQEWLHGRWVAKCLIKGVLSDFDGLTLSEIVIQNRLDGSPWAFVRGQEVQGDLSISHCEDWACAAFSRSTDITLGIDVEKVENRDPAFYTDYFTNREVKNKDLFPEIPKEKYYTFLWSAKESVLKALKLGLRIDTRKIEILPKDFDRTTGSSAIKWFPFLVRVFGRDENWSGFGQIREQFVITLASRGIKKSEPIVIQEIRL